MVTEPEPLTAVELVFFRDRIERWLRFGRDAGERILDRHRKLVLFKAGSVFAYLRWEGNEHGTVLSRVDVLRACGPAEIVSTVPGVTPGGEILLRLSGWPRVKRVLGAIDEVEQAGIDPADVAPEWWRHLHNRIGCNQRHRPYARPQHVAWQQRRRVGAA